MKNQVNEKMAQLASMMSNTDLDNGMSLEEYMIGVRTPINIMLISILTGGEYSHEGAEKKITFSASKVPTEAEVETIKSQLALFIRSVETPFIEKNVNSVTAGEEEDDSCDMPLLSSVHVKAPDKIRKKKITEMLTGELSEQLMVSLLTPDDCDELFRIGKELRKRKIMFITIMASAVAAVLIAGGTTAIVMARANKKKKQEEVAEDDSGFPEMTEDIDDVPEVQIVDEELPAMVEA